MAMADGGDELLLGHDLGVDSVERPGGGEVDQDQIEPAGTEILQQGLGVGGAEADLHRGVLGMKRGQQARQVDLVGRDRGDGSDRHLSADQTREVIDGGPGGRRRGERRTCIGQDCAAGFRRAQRARRTVDEELGRVPSRASKSARCDPGLSDVYAGQRRG